MTEGLDADVAVRRPPPSPPLATARARSAIEAEIARRRPVSVARNSLALMAESALLGQNLPADVSEEALAVAVRGVFEGLIARHPNLFVGVGVADPTAPAPVPAEAAPARRWFSRRERPAPPTAPRARRPPPAVTIRAPRPPITIAGWPLRDVALALGALVAIAAILFVLVSPAPAAKHSAAAVPARALTAKAAARAAPDIAETGTVAPPVSAVTGVAEIVGPASLRIEGRVVDLFGIEAPVQGSAEDLRAYLAGRAAACQPMPGSKAYSCEVEGHDLSEVILFNGGAKANAEATPALVAAEDHARAQRLGLWRR